MWIKTLLYSFIIVLLTAATPSASAQQEDVIISARNAIRSGNSKELTRFFSNMIELKIEGASDVGNNNFSKTQAEYVLKDFFKNNPPQSFEYIHEGASKDGLRYAIGKYTYIGSNSRPSYFRVYMMVKQFGGDIYQINVLSFTREDEEN
jgi:hypothetical protein